MSSGCDAGDPGALAGGALLAGVALLLTRRRRRADATR
jgi:LPXTG-motif cell wall-anchored protein